MCYGINLNLKSDKCQDPSSFLKLEMRVILNNSVKLTVLSMFKICHLSESARF